MNPGELMLALFVVILGVVVWAIGSIEIKAYFRRKGGVKA